MISLNDQDKAAVRAGLAAMGNVGAAKMNNLRRYAITAGAGFVAGFVAGWWLL